MEIADVVTYLNSLVEADPLAIRAMLCIRIPCNEELADHPTAQIDGEWPQGYTVGVMGIINGIFGIDDDGCGKISYTMNKDGSNLRFIRTHDDRPTWEDAYANEIYAIAMGEEV
jgi:hypothetical protein